MTNSQPSQSTNQDLRIRPPTPPNLGETGFTPPKVGGLGGQNDGVCVSPANKTKNTKIDKSRDKQQKFLHGIIAVSFVALAALIGVRGNLDVLSGKSPLDVIPSMIAQGVELILKAQSAEKSLKECDRKPRSHQ